MNDAEIRDAAIKLIEFLLDEGHAHHDIPEVILEAYDLAQGSLEAFEAIDQGILH